MDEKVQRVIEESVPGKQVTLAHVIASPAEEVNESLEIEKQKSLGILTLSPYETSIIAADIAIKAADVQLVCLDRFTGSLVIKGDVNSVETSLKIVCDTLQQKLGYMVSCITKT